MNDMYKDKIEYPLAKVNISDTSDYMLVKWQHSPEEKYEVITDTRSIKENASVFRIDNKGAIYGTTADGVFWLYKDGKQIGLAIFDNTLTRSIEYGTLQFQYINKLQYQLLVGHEIVEQGENHSILCDNRNEKPYYYAFAHGEDLKCTETVSLVNSESSLDKIAKPQRISNDLIEFTAHLQTYAGNETRHWYFRISDGKLSRSYLNVKVIQENIIVHADSDYRGPMIIVCDMFDKTGYYIEINGDFSKESDRLFLLSAEFTAEGNLIAEYIGDDGKVHNDIFSLR